MKRRQRKPVLEISGQSNSQERLQSRFKEVNNEQFEQNGSNNPLATLLHQYNSDSDNEDSTTNSTNKLDDQVNDFLKEIQSISSREPIANIRNNCISSGKIIPQSLHSGKMSLWQECFDESTGYPYYWHIETNEVTWEMPNELRLLKRHTELNPLARSTLQGIHWVDFSSITYRQSQVNIPEGMIPKEVVARNRNRHVHNEIIKKNNIQIDQDPTNTSDQAEDDSDEGHIEMITSYGSDGSDSDTTENDDSNKVIASVFTPVSTTEDSCKKLQNVEVGPSFPQLPQNSNFESGENPNNTDPIQLVSSLEVSDLQSVSVRTCTTEVESEKVLQEKDHCEYKKKKTSEHKDDVNIKKVKIEFPDTDTEIENETTKTNLSSECNSHKTEINVSLVPGYADSDTEEETVIKQEIKPLFPILQEASTEIDTEKLNSTELIKHDDNSIEDSQNEFEKINKEKQIDSSNEKLESGEVQFISKGNDDNLKSNKFLENVQAWNKAFQRKKRIAFDVSSNKSNIVMHNNDVDKQVNEDQCLLNYVESDLGGVELEKKLCTANEETCSETNQEITETSCTPKENISSSLKSESPEDTNCQTDLNTLYNPTDDKLKETEFNVLIETIMEKLKFLSEGKQTTSAVQTMMIQLQTLLDAWKADCLEKKYFHEWIVKTNYELGRLEQDATPSGWLCQWDRSHKRYYYQNTTSGARQWTYPDIGIAGGTEEMELCTTPSPPDQEEPTIRATLATKKTPEPVEEKVHNTNNEERNHHVPESRSTELEAPPPPQISNPSPPPPPRIFAEDLKQDKKRRDKCNEKCLEPKKKRLETDTVTVLTTTESSNLALRGLSHLQSSSPQTSVLSNLSSVEPLPPGVDSPDTSYEMSTSAHKGIIYSATPQADALFVASMGDSVPIITHQTALLQEPFIHYPYRHIHNQTALTIATKHGAQDAIHFMIDYAPVYTSNKVISKPPVKTAKESLGSALDSFYNDIANIEKTEAERQDSSVPSSVEVSTSVEVTKSESERILIPTESVVKERRKKKARSSISKKHKEMSTMVAKWQKAQQNLEEL